MSLLTITQAVCGRLGIPSPSAVIASSDPNIVVMRALANQEGRELARRATWQRLTIERSITTIAQEAQTSAIPSDFDRFVNETFWNYTKREPLFGPEPPDIWQQLKASLVGPPDQHFRVRGNDFLIIPTPPAGENIRFEYVSRWWVDTDADGLGESDVWTADADTALLDEEIIGLGVLWRWLKRNRLPYADEFGEYQAQVSQAISRDGARKTVSLAGWVDYDGPRRPGIPDGSWNL